MCFEHSVLEIICIESIISDNHLVSTSVNCRWQKIVCYC